MWPFSRKPRQDSKPGVLYFKSGQAFFEMQCEYGHTELEQGQGVIALVLDAKREFGAPVAVKINADGSQMAMIRVAADDGGFVVPATTPSKRGDRLQPGDVVVWVPGAYKEEIGAAFGDPRCGWVGLILAKVAAEYDPKNPQWNVLCEYN